MKYPSPTFALEQNGNLKVSLHGARLLLGKLRCMVSRNPQRGFL